MSVQSRDPVSRVSNNEAVQVIVRCRPLSDQEKRADCTRVVNVYSNRGVIEVENPKAKSENEKNKIFTYDAVYDWNSTQQCIYDETVRPLVSSVLEGYNGCVFAYGQTGTGKTYTMEGEETNPESSGIIPRAFEQIWTHINCTTGLEFLVTVRYLEIYMEDLRDLLKIKNPKALELREISGQGVFVTNLYSQTCQSAADMLKAMRKGNVSRTSGATNMNEHSSRSHAIFQIVIEMAEPKSKSVKVGKLNLIDLAGSERQSKTGATGERFKEATKINKALSSLGNVIYALAENSAHIPYRDSKLTRLLQDSLGGNSKTIMIANIGPANMNYEETIMTLRYAYRAKSIKNQPIKNEDIKDTKLLALQAEIERLKMLIEMKSKGIECQEGSDYAESSESEEDESKKDEKKKKLELGKLEVDELSQKLTTLEKQMVHGGKNIVDSVNENEVRLEQQKLEISTRKKREVEMQQKIELEEETCSELKQVFASLQQEVDFKRDKLKRLYAKLQSVRQEIKDNHKMYINDRKEIEEANDEAAMQLRQRFLIIDNFVPPEERSRLINLSQFDEDKDNWILKKEQVNILSVERPLGHHYRRPISEHAITSSANMPKYRGENVLDLKLDMPLRITQDYVCPVICPQIKATVANMILHDAENNCIVVKALPHNVGMRSASKMEHEGKYKQATKFVVEMQNYRTKMTKATDSVH